MKTWLKAVIAAAAVLVTLLAVYFLFFHPKENDPKMMEKIQIEKIASPAHTVSVGGEITYTVSVTNGNARRARVLITDALPEDVTFVSGDFEAEGGLLKASVTVGGKQTKTVSYTVRIGDSYEEGDLVSAPAASVADLKRSAAVEHYVGRTLNDAEKERMRDGILALMYSENIDPVKLAKDMYLVAFTETITLGADVKKTLNLLFAESLDANGEKLAATVVPSLYRAPATLSDAENRFRGESTSPKITDLMIGDLLLYKFGTETILYIFDGNRLLSLMDGAKAVDTDAVLADFVYADCYAVLRPSLTLVTLNYALEPQNETLTQAQKVLIATAKAYLQRGYRAQYDDTRMYAGIGSGEYRWQIGQYNPEDYTADKWGYLNCAAFTYDMYRTALGLDIGGLYTTYNLASYYVNGGEVGAPMYPFVYFSKNDLSDGQKNAVKNKFMSTLEVGDLVVVRRSNGSGHVMFYIGDGVLIHSGGANFDYTNDQETYEPTIRYMNVLGYIFNPDATNYLFRKDAYVASLSIVRPLDRFASEGLEIPENSLNRMANLEDIYAEKLSSHPEGRTANVGETITFTFRIENRGFAEKTLEIKDIVPAGTVLKSAGDFSHRDGALSAKVKVGAGEEISVSYTVTVSGAAGTVIHEKGATVGGVLHTCAPITVANTLSEDAQAAISAAIEALRAENPQGLTNFDLANAIYEAAGLEAPFADGADVRGALIHSDEADSKASWTFIEESEYASLLVPTLYGGRHFFTAQQYTASEKPNTDRSRLPREQALVVGDILVAKFSSSERVFIYAGDGVFVNLTSASMPIDTYSATERLMRMMSCWHYYFVLRPSMG